MIVLLNYAPFGGTNLQFDSALTLLSGVVAIAVLSVASHALVEKKYANQFNLRGPRLVLFSLVIAAAFGLCHFNLNKFDETEKRIFAAWTDRDTYRCGKLFRILNPLEPACQLTHTNSGGRILLVGNSHADSIKKVFSEVALKHGHSTYFIVANDPLVNSARGGLFVSKLAVSNSIDVVFVHFNNVYKSENARMEILNLIKSAKSHGIKVVVVGPVPTYAVHVPEAMFRDHGRAAHFATNLTEHREATRHYLSFVSQVETAGGTVIDPAVVLCPSGGQCLFADADSTPFYFDSDHLTLTGAATLAPLFEMSLREVK